MKKQTLLFSLIFIALSALGIFFYLNASKTTPYTVDENAVYKISASDCFYSIYSEKDGGLFYVSGETKVDVSNHLDKPVRIRGRFIYTQQTSEGTNRLLYRQDKLQSGECSVNNTIGAVAIVIDSIE